MRRSSTCRAEKKEESDPELEGSCHRIYDPVSAAGRKASVCINGARAIRRRPHRALSELFLEVGPRGGRVGRVRGTRETRRTKSSGIRSEPSCHSSRYG